MYYEVYIDFMFLVNFIMDVLILFSVKALMKMPGSTKRVIAGGLVGSGLSCLVVILRSGRIRAFLPGGNFAAARGNHNGSASYACQQRDGGMRS